jgi:hypothetical protein
VLVNRRSALPRSPLAHVRRGVYPFLALALAVLLSACSFSTDTVATVGPEKITRGELVALAGSSPSSQAQALDTLIYSRLIDLAARAHGVTVDNRQVNAQIAADLATAQGTENFASFITQNYASAAAYQQNARQQLLIEGLRPYWAKPTVQAITLQLLATDTQQKAQEVVQKGRAGASFDDLLKQYAPPAAQTPDVVNSQGSIAVDALNPAVRASFGPIQAGAWSDPIPNNGQFIVLHIAAVEDRAPTEREKNGLVAAWLDSLRTVYPVTITDPALRAATNQ